MLNSQFVDMNPAITGNTNLKSWNARLLVCVLVFCLRCSVMFSARDKRFCILQYFAGTLRVALNSSLIMIRYLNQTANNVNRSFITGDFYNLLCLVDR